MDRYPHFEHKEKVTQLTCGTVLEKVHKMWPTATELSGPSGFEKTYWVIAPFNLEQNCTYTTNVYGPLKLVAHSWPTRGSASNVWLRIRKVSPHAR